jgi:hypothetical protein
MSMRSLKLKIFGMIFLALAGSSCSKSPTQSLPAAPPADILAIGGGAIAIQAQDLPLWLTSQQILDDVQTPVVDGTLFIVTGSNNIPVSVDGITFSNSIKVASKNSVIYFASRPSTQVGTYTIQVTQNQKQTRNAIGTFYVSVTPAEADDLGQITTNRVETIPPPAIRYSALADGVTAAQVSVGPIIDKYGNTLSGGYVRLVTDKGQIVSTNPAIISDGYVFFSYLPTTDDTSVNVQAQAVDEAADVIIKELIGTIYQVKPNLQFSADQDLGNFLLGQSTSVTATLTNNGSTYANNLTFSTTLPFSLPSIATQCPTILQVGQACSFTIQATSNSSANFIGSVVAQAAPTNIPQAKAILGVVADAVSPASLAVSSSSLTFNSVCDKTVDKVITVSNSGQIDATNFSVVSTAPMSQDTENACNALTTATCSTNSLCRWSTVSSSCTSKAFDIIVPPADAVITGTTANCGNVIPAGGVGCNLTVRFYPLSLYSNYQTSFRVQADNVTPVPVNLTATSGIGDPAIQIPISLNKTSIGLSHTDLATVTLGPVVDECGNKLNNIDTYSSTVTAGTLSLSAGPFTNGGATFNWNGSDNLTDMGTQTLTVTAGTITNSATLLFTGVNISLASNPSNIGEINADSSVAKTWIVQNTGNQATSITNISFTNLTNLTLTSTDITGCATLPANGTCTVSALFAPQITTDPTSVQFSGQITVTSPSRGQSTATTQFLGFSSHTLNVGNNDTQFYYLGQAPAGVGLTKTINIRNNSSSSLNALNYSLSGTVTNWTLSPGTCGVTLDPGLTCALQISYSSADVVAGNKQSTLNITSGVRYSTITLSLDLIGDINNINPSVPMSATVSAIPADGTTTTSVTAGPIKDLLGNQLPTGTAVYFSAGKGTIVEAQPLYTNASGTATVTVQSVSNEVGNGTIRADVKNAASTVVASGFQTIQFTGTNLVITSPATPLDFGSVPIGQFQDETITVANTGTAAAPNLTITTDNAAFTLADLGTCAIGSLNPGQSCNVVVRYNSSALVGTAGVTSTLTAVTSEPTGQNRSTLSLHAVSLLPATLTANIKTLAIPLSSNNIYATQITLSNIGQDTLKNFTLSSNSANVLVSSYSGCNNLIGGGSCQFTLTFNSNGISSLFSSIITATGDNTSFQINFIADTLNLAFINPTFNANAFSCQPVQVESQDSNGNAMTMQTTQTISLTSNKLGSFYSNKACSGTTVSQISIPQGGTTTQQVYFEPKIAGKHLLSAIDGTIIGTQENLANIVISPGNALSGSPMQPIAFTALGADGAINCNYVLNASGAVSPIPVVGQTCNYVVGNLGNLTDRILLSDSDNPPNTAAIQISIGAPVVITPTSAIVNSGQQVQFTASNGSGTGYVFTTTPNQPNKKIGSSIYGNIFTAGQNVTGTDNLVETITVTDSFGASATALVQVKQSIFTQEQVVSAPTTGAKSVAMWGNFMLVGDPTAITPANVQGAGAIHVYQKNTSVANQTTWSFLSTIYSPFPEVNGAFGQSVAMWSNQIVVGAPSESGTADAAASGVVYQFTLGADGTAGTMTRIFSSYNKQLKPSEHFGQFVAITKQFLAGYNPNSGIVSIYDYTNFVQNGSSCQVQGFAPCPDEELQPNGDGATAIAIYYDPNYGGAYLAVGSANDGLGSPALAGSGAVRVYERQYTSTSGADWITDANQTVLPLTQSNISAGAHLGQSIAMYGPYIIAGAPGYNNGTGRVLVFRRDPNIGDNVWSTEFVIDPTTLNPYINQNSNFGQNIAYFGNYILVGSPGETNYNGLANSGTAYVFQRYLSDSNNWEFLGQLRSTDYGASNNFSSAMAVYTNDYAIASFNNNTGLIYTFNGSKSLNKWPFGFHGIFSTTADYHQPAGTMKDWASLVLPAQFKYIIDPVVGQFSYIGVAGDIALNGVLQSNGSTFNGTITGQEPDDSGFILGQTDSYQIVQSAGGFGGVGLDGVTHDTFSGEDGSNSGIVNYCMTVDYVTTGPNSSNAAPGYDITTGVGGVGGVGVSPTGNCAKTGDTGIIYDSAPGGGGGSGGGPGQNGQAIWLKITGLHSGAGTIDVSGGIGGTGLAGAGGGATSNSKSDGGSADENIAYNCSRFTGDGNTSDYDGGNSTCQINAQGGSGGGGGGGAGGTAGYVVINTSDGVVSTPFNIFLSQGPGGGSQTNGTAGYPGLYGCYNINGAVDCGSVVLKDSSAIVFVAGKTYNLAPSNGVLNIYDVTDGNTLVQDSVGYYLDNGFSIQQTCVWEFSTITIPAGVTIKVDPQCKWLQILATKGFNLNGTILANNAVGGSSSTYLTSEISFSGEFTSIQYSYNLNQTNGGNGGLSYVGVDGYNYGSTTAPQPVYSYQNYAGSAANGNGGGGSGQGASVGQRNASLSLAGDAANTTTSVCNQARSVFGATGVFGNACTSISTLGATFPGGGGFRGSSGQGVIIKSQTPIVGSGTISVAGTAGGSGGDSFSYDGNETVNNPDNEDNPTSNITLTPVDGAGGGGAGGSGGVIIVKAPSNPANINFLYGAGSPGAGGASHVHTVTTTTSPYYGTSTVTADSTNSQAAGQAGNSGSAGSYNFIKTTTFP